jgi:hypothetical protein
MKNRNYKMESKETNDFDTGKENFDVKEKGKEKR